MIVRNRKQTGTQPSPRFELSFLCKKSCVVHRELKVYQLYRTQVCSTLVSLSILLSKCLTRFICEYSTLGMRVHPDTHSTQYHARNLPSTEDSEPSSANNIKNLIHESAWTPLPVAPSFLQRVSDDFHPGLEELPSLSSTFPPHVDPTLQTDFDNTVEDPETMDAKLFPKRRAGNGNRTVVRTDIFAPNAAALFKAATAPRKEKQESPGPASPTTPISPNSIQRLPPILQVEKKTVTTQATQQASASRRRNEAHYHCPVPGCGSTFTRRFNLRGKFLCHLISLLKSICSGHLRSHTEERPFVCSWPGCGKGFARQHDCK
jgi:hypothetical protein